MGSENRLAIWWTSSHGPRLTVSHHGGVLWSQPGRGAGGRGWLVDGPDRLLHRNLPGHRHHPHHPLRHLLQTETEEEVQLWSQEIQKHGANLSKLSEEFPGLQSGQRESLPEEVSESDWNQESSRVWTERRDQSLSLRGIHQPP